MLVRRGESGLYLPTPGIQVARVFPATLAQSYSDKVNALSPIAYWRLSETVGPTADNYEGTAARDGTYINTPTLNQTGIGDGLPAPTFAYASSENVDIYSTSLNTAFDGATGSVAGWVQVSGSSIWTDGNRHYMVRIQVDGNNLLLIRKRDTNNTVLFYRVGGGTAETVSVGGQSSTDWMHFAMTWKEADGGEFKAYINGSQVGSTQTSLGAWTGSLVSTNCVCFAASTAGGDSWDGGGAHWSVFATVLTDPNIASLATV